MTAPTDRPRAAGVARVARFGMVGVAATLTHAATLALLVEAAGLWPPLANTLAFMVAFAVSYLGHRRFTFRSDRPHAESLASYLLVATSGAAANFFLFVLLNDLLGWPYGLVFALGLVIVTPLVYLASRTFAFAPDAPTPLAWARAHPGRWVPAAAAFLLAAAMTLSLHHPLPYYDHWDLLPLYGQARAGELTLGELFAPHGGHWHATAYMVLLVLARLTGLSHTAEVAASLLVALAGSVFLYRIASDAARRTGRPALIPWLFGLTAFVFFSLDQAPNWLWGWQVAVFLNTTGVAATIWLLTRPRLDAAGLAGAMAASAIAIYAFANGLLLLPLGALLILLHDSGRARRAAALIAWSVVSAALLAQYVLQIVQAPAGYVGQSAPPALTLETLLGVAVYALTFVGGAVGRFSDGLALPLAILGAALGAICAIVVLRRGAAGRAAILPGLAFCVYGLGAGALTALGRLQFGPDQALVSRYISFSNLFWIGVLLLAVLALGELTAKSARRSLVAALALLLLFKVGNVLNVAVAKGLPANRAELRAAAVQIRDGWPTPPAEALAKVSSPEQDIAPALAVMARYRLGLFEDAPPRP